MAQKNLGKLYPKIEGDADFGFKHISFITTDTAFAASAGLSGVAVAGQLRYDTSDAQYKYWNGSAEVALAAASAAGTGLDGNYDINKTITIDAGPVVMSGSSTDDHLQIATSGNTATGKSLIDLVLTGTPHVDSNMLRFDVSGATTTGVPTLLEVVGSGETVQGIYVDTDLTSKHAVHFHCGGALTNGLAVLGLTNDGNLAAGGNLLNVTLGGTPADSTVAAVEIVAAEDCQALDIQTSGATQSAVLITGSGATANNTAVFEVNWGSSTPANAGSNLVRLDASDADNTVKPVILEVYDDSVSTAASFISSPTGNDCVIIQGDGAMTNGMAALAVSGSGDIAAGGCVAELILDGSSPDTDARVLEVMAGAKDVRAVYIDSASATNDGVYILNDGALAAGKAAVKIDINGDINATANALLVESTGATATNNAYLVKFDTNSKDAGALYVDCDAATDSAVHIHGGGALASDQAMLELTSDGTPANAGSNMLRIDTTAADNTIVPIAVEIVGTGETVQAIYSDVDITSRHAHHFHGGGALTNGLGVVGITSDGALAAGGNVLNVTYTGTPAASSVCALEVLCAKDCQAMAIATSAATQSGVLITGSGATADNTAVFEVNWGASTPANAGANLVRIDGSGATNTIKPVLLEILDDDVSVGLSVSTASIEDMVTFIGTGATGSAKAVVDITSTAVMNAGGNLLRLDVTGADTTAVPNVLEIVGTGETARGIYIDTDGTSKGAALFHSGGALTNGVGVVMITNDGNLAAGGNLLNLTMGGTPANATVAAAEIVCAKDCLALDIATSAATTYGVQITGIGAINDNKAVLGVLQATGTMANGSAIVRIEGSTAATATAYGLEIACNATNLEALNVSLGTSTFAETANFPGGAVLQLGTTADLTDTTPTSAEFDTAFGAANKTKGGFVGVVEDSGSGVTYLAVSDGTTWHFALLTAAG